MVDLKGAWESTEVITYTPTGFSLDVRTQVFNYRHKLMEKFVEAIHTQTTSVVESTRIIHTMLERTSGDFETTFEFTVTGLDIDPGATYVVWLRNRMDTIIGRLMDALEAESKLAKAQQEVTRNSFE